MIENNLQKKGIFVNPAQVHDTLKKHMLVDGFDITLDLKKSQGAYLYDSRNEENLLDFFTFFASNPIGMNHPKLRTEEFIREIGEIAVSKPSLSDVYTTEMAEFVETFFKIAVPDYFKYAFFIEGGALAVENTLKTAFDWKVQKNFQKGYKEEKGFKIIHFKEAFHGRSGYTLSLTNTDPTKIKYFPKFDWPRITNPKIIFPLENNLDEVIKSENIAVEEIKKALTENKDDIAALIIEPIQGEGGDNHFRKEFLLKLRELCDENEMLYIMDEVQTGIAMTGKMWAHMHFVKPDIISFGKKTQVCGILSTNRIDDLDTNVFRVSSRINSTWGGNIVDMHRFKRILEIIDEDKLVDNAETMGKYLLNNIYELQCEFPEIVSGSRGKGLFAAFDCPGQDVRNQIISEAKKRKLMILSCGQRTLRFRPNLAIKKDEIDAGFKILKEVLKSI